MKDEDETRGRGDTGTRRFSLVALSASPVSLSPRLRVSASPVSLSPRLRVSASPRLVFHPSSLTFSGCCDSIHRVDSRLI